MLDFVSAVQVSVWFEMITSSSDVDLPAIVALKAWSSRMFDLAGGVTGCRCGSVSGRLCGLLRVGSCRSSELLSVAGWVVGQAGGISTNFVALIFDGAAKASQTQSLTTRTTEVSLTSQQCQSHLM